MKTVITILLFLLLTPLSSQVSKIIHTNERQAVAMFFPHEIRQAVVGSPDFTFSYNTENPQHVGLLQGIKGVRSNLLVITNANEVFSYLLHYKKELDTFNFFISSREKIGFERPMVIATPKIGSLQKIDTVETEPINTKSSYRQAYFEKFSAYHLKHNKNKLKRKRKNGLILELKDLIYDRTEVYALIEIKNKSGIDFEVDYLKTFKENGNNRKKASYQKLILKPLLSYKFPSIIGTGKSASFVIVLPKFTFGDSEKLLLELNELNGSRLLYLRTKS